MLMWVYFLEKNSQTQFVFGKIESNSKMFTVAHITTGKFNISVKFALGSSPPKTFYFKMMILREIDKERDMISLKKELNDKKRSYAHHLQWKCN